MTTSVGVQVPSKFPKPPPRNPPTSSSASSSKSTSSRRSVDDSYCPTSEPPPFSPPIPPLVKAKSDDGSSSTLLPHLEPRSIPELSSTTSRGRFPRTHSLPYSPSRPQRRPLTPAGRNLHKKRMSLPARPNSRKVPPPPPGTRNKNKNKNQLKDIIASHNSKHKTRSNSMRPTSLQKHKKKGSLQSRVRSVSPRRLDKKKFSTVPGRLSPDLIHSQSDSVTNPRGRSQHPKGLPKLQFDDVFRSNSLTSQRSSTPTPVSPINSLPESLKPRANRSKSEMVRSPKHLTRKLHDSPRELPKLGGQHSLPANLPPLDEGFLTLPNLEALPSSLRPKGTMKSDPNYKTCQKGPKTNTKLLLENYASHGIAKTPTRNRNDTITSLTRRKKRAISPRPNRPNPVDVSAGREKLETELNNLQNKIHVAASQQNYELCSSLQPRVDELEVMLNRNNKGSSKSAGGKKTKSPKTHGSGTGTSSSLRIPQPKKFVRQSSSGSLNNLEQCENKLAVLKDRKKTAMRVEDFDAIQDINSEIHETENEVNRLQLSMKMHQRRPEFSDLQTRIEELEREREIASGNNEFSKCIQLSQEIEKLQSELTDMQSQHRRSMTWIEAITSQKPDDENSNEDESETLEFDKMVVQRTPRGKSRMISPLKLTKKRQKKRLSLRPASTSYGLTKQIATDLCVAFYNCSTENKFLREMYEVLDIQRSAQNLVVVTYKWKDLKTQSIELDKTMFFLFDKSGAGEWSVLKMKKLLTVEKKTVGISTWDKK